MIRLALAAFALATIAGANDQAAFNRDLAKFNDHYVRFFRAYLGCPKDAREVEQCDPKLGTFDYSEFNAARREAHKLFDK